VKVHRLRAEPTHSCWDRSLEPRLRIAPGETVHVECVDASGGQVKPGMTLEELQSIDRTRIHALTGPIWIEGAEPGDVLEVEVLSLRHHGWGWSSVLSGLGFLKERFPDPYLFHWHLDDDLSASLEPAVIPLRPFLGVMGVARADAGSFRTRPPGPFGGNMDVPELSAGAKLYLPVFNSGALFSCGDGHAAQGHGEVCVNGIECALDATLCFRLHSQQVLSAPLVESSDLMRGDSTAEAWIVVESGGDIAETARRATGRMIDLLVSRWGFQDVHAYILCSVAMSLKLSQVVNEPMHTVTAAISKAILPRRTLFPLQ